LIRLFVQARLGEGEAIELGPERAHYLSRVMRLAPGEAVLVFNGRDGEWRARLESLGRRSALAVVEARTRLQAAGSDLELIVALVKRAALETIVEKATELGVRRVRLVTSERTNADHANVARLGLIAMEAAEQCGRLDVPPIEAPEPLAGILASWPRGRRLMFCDEAGDAPEPIRALGAGSGAPWAVLVGPEGGFSGDERARLRSHDAVRPVWLGPRILRADTAAIAALALWQASLGDWGA